MEKRWMIEVARELLIPALEALGFQHKACGSTKITIKDLGPHFPLGFFHRANPSGLDVVEPYFFGRYKFVLHAARIPLDGISGPLGHNAAEDCLATWNATWFTLYKCPSLLIPFSARRFFGGPLPRPDVERIVRGVVQLLPEIDAALNEGKAGRHLKKIVR